MPSTKIIVSFGLFAVARLVAGHGAITQATGDAGGAGMALGIDTSTPRDGTRRNPFQRDSTRFRGAQADTFGETLAGGDNNLEAGTRAIMAETGEQLPQITQGGEVSMTLHQVNADGGGKLTAVCPGPGVRAQVLTMHRPLHLHDQRRRDWHAVDPHHGDAERAGEKLAE